MALSRATPLPVTDALLHKQPAWRDAQALAALMASEYGERQSRWVLQTLVDPETDALEERDQRLIGELLQMTPESRRARIRAIERANPGSGMAEQLLGLAVLAQVRTARLLALLERCGNPAAPAHAAQAAATQWLEFCLGAREVVYDFSVPPETFSAARTEGLGMQEEEDGFDDLFDQDRGALDDDDRYLLEDLSVPARGRLEH